MSGQFKSLTENLRNNYSFSYLRINIRSIIPVYIEQAWHNFYALPQMKFAIIQLVCTQCNYSLGCILFFMIQYQNMNLKKQVLNISCHIM